MTNERVFQWGDKKAASNLKRHKVSFEAIYDFCWNEADLAIDNRADYGEERWKAVGPVGDRIMVVVFTERGDETRIISLRKANRREIERWFDG